jgi:hypothetical protein
MIFLSPTILTEVTINYIKILSAIAFIAIGILILTGKL